MSFDHYLCWDPSQLKVRLQTEADFSADHVFLATNSDFLIGRLSRTPGKALRDWPVAFVRPSDVLESFLAEEGGNLTRMVVLGDSGSGKSHFIHWLKLRIPPIAGRHVVSVPRSGMNLRSVLEQLIALLPQDRRALYKEELRQSRFTDASPELRIEVLLDAIAQSFPTDRELVAATANDEDRALLQSLPDLFRDPPYRRYLAAQPILRDLVDHIGQARSEYAPAPGRLELASHHLPLSAVQTHEMSRPAQEILNELRGDGALLSRAIELINRNLDTAIGTAINFGGSRLGELMKDVRRELDERGQELVLLVEDLALLQGIDSALIDALLVQPQPGERLCPMRWAMAMTSGYYDRSVDTLKTRIDIVIDMDRRNTEEGREFGDDDLVPFAARYLNAARLSEEDLLGWAARLVPDEETPPPPIFCTTCEHREPCHAAFGASNDVGLYPFRREALVNMARRKGVISDGRFNPRLFIQDVLREVLGEGYELQNDAFPPTRLREAMAGVGIQPVTRQRLARSHSVAADRMETVLTLWSRTAQQPDVMPPGLWAAFGLPQPELLGDGVIDAPPPLDVPALAAPPPGDPTASPAVAAVHAWANGSILPQRIANDLRGIVFEAVVATIDWDGEGLVRTVFAQGGDGHWFRRTSINFDGQAGQVQPRQVQLQIPGPGLTRDDAALALEALLLIGNEVPLLPSSVSERGQKLAALTVALEHWAHQVVVAIRAHLGKDGGDRIVGAAVETLATALVLSGVEDRVPADGAPAAWLDALFKELPAPAPHVERGSLQELYRDVRAGAAAAQELLRGLCTASKGGDRGAVIDAARILPALERVTRGWLLGPELPAMANIELLDQVRTGHQRLRARLEESGRREMEQRGEAVRAIRELLPADQELALLIQSLAAFRTAASAEGVFPAGQAASRFDVARTLIEARQVRMLQGVLTEADRLERRSSPLPRLPLLARVDRGQALRDLRTYIEAAETITREVRAVVDAEQIQLGGRDSVSRVAAEAADELRQVDALLGKVER